MFAEPQASVITLLDDILEAVVGDDVQLYVGIGGGECTETRRDYALRRQHRHGDAQRAGRTAGTVRESLDRRGDVGERRLQGLQKLAPLRRRGGTTGGARHQAEVQAFLQGGDRMTYRRGCDAEFGGRLAEAAVMGDGGEDGELRQLGSVH